MHYRLYALHPMSGKILKGQDILAETDRDAIDAGQRAHPVGAFEIWCGSRRVFGPDTDALNDTRTSGTAA